MDLLPAGALICSCNSVTKGGICDAVAAGATTLGALKKQTKASTTCGGCGPLVKQILDAELRKRGVDVKNHLCEHFPYSRQELFHLTRVGGLRTFDEIIAKHGQGRGCDICKPAVASILAACWNEYILKPRHAPLQDTNDHFLANLQKNGTYSIVPRVPGGEITPEKLIVLGEVARKFGLYTKITGAQRIDLFGARVEQLPLIWRELVDAGFESGHAYGKALRTVKSCVGSTWCRYGVQDSVLDGDQHREPLPRPALAAQAQDGGVGLHARVRRGAGQGRRHHRDGERLEPLRLRQRRHEAAPRRPPRHRPRRRARSSATSTASSCSTSAPATACSARAPGSRTSKAASTTCGRSCARTRSA